MSGKVKHIALFQVLIFLVTFLPFRLWHSHDHESRHHETAEKSFCHNTDGHSGADEFDHCGHDNHLKTTTPGCFVCDIHFIENFNISECEFSFVDTGKQLRQGEYVSLLASGNYSFPKNKSPPFIS